MGLCQSKQSNDVIDNVSYLTTPDRGVSIAQSNLVDEQVSKVERTNVTEEDKEKSDLSKRLEEDREENATSERLSNCEDSCSMHEANDNNKESSDKAVSAPTSKEKDAADKADEKSEDVVASDSYESKVYSLEKEKDDDENEESGCSDVHSIIDEIDEKKTDIVTRISEPLASMEDKKKTVTEKIEVDKSDGANDIKSKDFDSSEDSVEMSLQAKRYTVLKSIDEVDKKKDILITTPISEPMVTLVDKDMTCKEKREINESVDTKMNKRKESDLGENVTEDHLYAKRQKKNIADVDKEIIIIQMSEPANMNKKKDVDVDEEEVDDPLQAKRLAEKKKKEAAMQPMRGVINELSNVFATNITDKKDKDSKSAEAQFLESDTAKDGSNNNCSSSLELNVESSATHQQALPVKNDSTINEQVVKHNGPGYNDGFPKDLRRSELKSEFERGATKNINILPSDRVENLVKVDTETGTLPVVASELSHRLESSESVSLTNVAFADDDADSTDNKNMLHSKSLLDDENCKSSSSTKVDTGLEVEDLENTEESTNNEDVETNNHQYEDRIISDDREDGRKLYNNSKSEVKVEDLAKRKVSTNEDTGTNKKQDEDQLYGENPIKKDINNYDKQIRINSKSEVVIDDSLAYSMIEYDGTKHFVESPKNSNTTLVFDPNISINTTACEFIEEIESEASKMLTKKDQQMSSNLSTVVDDRNDKNNEDEVISTTLQDGNIGITKIIQREKREETLNIVDLLDYDEEESQNHNMSVQTYLKTQLENAKPGDYGNGGNMPPPSNNRTTA